MHDLANVANAFCTLYDTWRCMFCRSLVRVWQLLLLTSTSCWILVLSPCKVCKPLYMEISRQPTSSSLPVQVCLFIYLHSFTLQIPFLSRKVLSHPLVPLASIATSINKTTTHSSQAVSKHQGYCLAQCFTALYCNLTDSANCGGVLSRSGQQGHRKLAKQHGSLCECV